MSITQNVCTKEFGNAGITSPQEGHKRFCVTGYPRTLYTRLEKEKTVKRKSAILHFSLH
jgi:hypothetical protein